MCCAWKLERTIVTGDSGAAVAPAASSLGGADPSERTRQSAQALDVDRILSAVGETAYAWDLASDEIYWSRNVAEVLQIADPGSIARGRTFALLVDPEHAQMRAKALTPPDDQPSRSRLAAE